MPRITRGLSDGSICHIINRGNGKQNVFHDDFDYLAFIKLLHGALTRYEVKLYAYCLMPNHFHLLVTPKSAADLSKMMQWLMTSHVRRYHQHYKTSGHVWQGRFKSFIVKDDDHFLTVARYIEANPVRAGLVPSALEWQWSSHIERVGGESELISQFPIPWHVDNWTDYVDVALTDKELDKLRTSVNRQAPYGEEAWQLETCKKLGLESTLKSRGRPKKRGQATLL